MAHSVQGFVIRGKTYQVHPSPSPIVFKHRRQPSVVADVEDVEDPDVVPPTTTLTAHGTRPGRRSHTTDRVSSQYHHRRRQQCAEKQKQQQLQYPISSASHRHRSCEMVEDDDDELIFAFTPMTEKSWCKLGMIEQEQYHHSRTLHHKS